MDEIDDGEKMIFLLKAFRLHRKRVGLGRWSILVAAKPLLWPLICRIDQRNLLPAYRFLLLGDPRLIDCFV